MSNRFRNPSSILCPKQLHTPSLSSLTAEGITQITYLLNSTGFNQSLQHVLTLAGLCVFSLSLLHHAVHHHIETSGSFPETCKNHQKRVLAGFTGP